MKHTPTPWAIYDKPAHSCCWEFIGVNIEQAVRDEVADPIFEADEANARHIVKCVNNHDRLVEALDGLLDMWDGAPIDEWEKARALLAELDAQGEE